METVIVSPMRIGLISDIHGNLVALDAVLADCRAGGVEQFWFLGDYAAIGPEPAAVIDRVAGLSNALFIRGNTDRYVVTGEGPPPHLAAVRADPTLIPTFASLAASFAWTRGFLTGAGRLDWLADLPLEIRTSTPNGIRLLAVHAAPGTDDGEGIHPGSSNRDLAALVAGAAADVLVVGHTHEAMVRRVGSGLIVNLGSVSNPRAPEHRATYAWLDVGDTALEVTHRLVPYDNAEFTERVIRSRHPAADFILSHQRGEVHGRAPHPDHTPLPRGGTRVTPPS